MTTTTETSVPDLDLSDLDGVVGGVNPASVLLFDTTDLRGDATEAASSGYIRVKKLNTGG